MKLIMENWRNYLAEEESSSVFQQVYKKAYETAKDEAIKQGKEKALEKATDEIMEKAKEIGSPCDILYVAAIGAHFKNMHNKTIPKEVLNGEEGAMRDYKASLARGESEKFLKNVIEFAISDIFQGTDKATDLINDYFSFTDQKDSSYSGLVTKIVKNIELFVLKLLGNQLVGAVFPAYAIGHLVYMAYRNRKCPFEIEEKIGRLPIEKFGGLRIGDVDDRGIVNFEKNPEGWCRASHNKDKYICKRLAAGMTVTLKNGKKVKFGK